MRGALICGIGCNRRNGFAASATILWGMIVGLILLARAFCFIDKLVDKRHVVYCPGNSKLIQDLRFSITAIYPFVFAFHLSTFSRASQKMKKKMWRNFVLR